jgi:hypothetical protein
MRVENTSTFHVCDSKYSIAMFLKCSACDKKKVLDIPKNQSPGPIYRKSTFLPINRARRFFMYSKFIVLFGAKHHKQQLKVPGGFQSTGEG